MTYKKPYGGTSAKYWREKKALENWTQGDRSLMRELLESRRQVPSQNQSPNESQSAQQLSLFETSELEREKPKRQSKRGAVHVQSLK